ncbi:peptidylprolyl isomerase [Sphingomonas laterariae]|uniref:peptidylprolyl isomerase n=1 Tax=Edaphosphingomonas laterariae TaxID=861865 RepID=A0A239BWQ5_9SPHN|nr:peptidylprolyl isomerase [Sphingomonas laterariae]SNS12320.1 peptidylprolyl isomerase [Sphingomonas laterariae]
MKYSASALAGALAVLFPTLAQGAAPPTPSQIVAAAPAADWVDVAPENLLVMDLADGGRVAIELAPAFAPVHVANIRTLARARWFDDTSINRVQDNYVTQWGDPTERKQLSIGTVASPPAEYDRAVAGSGFQALPYRDAYAPKAGHAGGWPAASDGKAAWLVHCYGMVGAGRGMAPDTGTGAELYAVIGHGPRHLDRNIATVGRVLEGMDRLAALPRGTEALGFYARPEQRIGIGSIRLGSDMPAAERPAYQILRQGSPSFAAWVKARANRQDDFFIRPAGSADICNLQPPVRRKP